MILSYECFGRLDVLMLAIMFLSITLIIRKKYWMVPLLTMAGMLVHEGYVLFCMLIPEMFLAAEYIKTIQTQENTEPIPRSQVSLIICGILNAATGFIMFAYFKWGCHLIYDSNGAYYYFVDKFRKSGVLNTSSNLVLKQEILGESIPPEAFAITSACSRTQLIGGLIIGVMSLLPLLLILFRRWRSIILKTYPENRILPAMFFLLSISWLYIVPVFFVHIDYGRWLFYILIHMMFAVIIMHVYFDIRFSIPKEWLLYQGLISMGGNAFALSMWLRQLIFHMF